jgi:hypothetical protein
MTASASATVPTCPYCGQPYATGEGCAVGQGVYLYGTEPFVDWAIPERCRDCGVNRLEAHHPSCCVAWCQRCDQQAYLCDCELDELSPARQAHRRHVEACVLDLMYDRSP